MYFSEQLHATTPLTLCFRWCSGLKIKKFGVIFCYNVFWASGEWTIAPSAPMATPVLRLSVSHHGNAAPHLPLRRYNLRKHCRTFQLMTIKPESTNLCKVFQRTAYTQRRVKPVNRQGGSGGSGSSKLPTLTYMSARLTLPTSCSRTSSSFSAFLHQKGWRRVVSLSNTHDLPLLPPLH